MIHWISKKKSLIGHQWIISDLHVIPLLLLIGFQLVDVMLFECLLLTLTAQSLQVNQSALHLLKLTFQMSCTHIHTNIVNTGKSYLLCHILSLWLFISFFKNTFNIEDFGIPYKSKNRIWIVWRIMKLPIYKQHILRCTVWHYGTICCSWWLC